MIISGLIQGKKFSQRSLFWKKKIQNSSLKFKIFSKKFRKEKDLRYLKKNIIPKNRVFFRQNWVWELSLGIFFLLFGFFSATSAITIIGSVADWDPLAAAVLLCWIELFTKVFYNSEKITNPFKFLNSFKIGIVLGMFVDAFKLTG